MDEPPRMAPSRTSRTLSTPLDPLADLIEKTAADPGAPFAPEILAALADLKKADRAAFETLRAGLKRTGCRVTALDDALAEESGSGVANARAQTQTDILLRLAQAADLFHTPDLTCYADLDIKGHRETWLIRSRGFNRWLARAFFDETNGASGLGSHGGGAQRDRSQSPL